MSKTYKKRASEAMSRFVRLRDSLDYCKDRGIDLGQFIRPEDIIGQCCTCGAVKSWIRMQAGHCRPRGTGGASGVYFFERNVHLQCCRCNKWGGGREADHREFIVRKYSQAVLDELDKKHHVLIDMGDFAMKAMEIFYTDKYTELIEANEL